MGLGVAKDSDHSGSEASSSPSDLKKKKPDRATTNSVAADNSQDAVKAVSQSNNEENDDEEPVVDSIFPAKASPFFSFTDFVKDAKQQLGYCHLDGWGGACSVDKQQALE